MVALSVISGGKPEEHNIAQVINNLQILNATMHQFNQIHDNIFMQNYNDNDIQRHINLFWVVFNRFFQFRHQAQNILTSYPNLIHHAVVNLITSLF